jgi:CubicO group peptidase (beta-lactamase class C family)
MKYLPGIRNKRFTGLAFDFARFGRLYLNRGYWNGKNIIPAEWVRSKSNPGTYFLNVLDNSLEL